MLQQLQLAQTVPKTSKSSSTDESGLFSDTTGLANNQRSMGLMDYFPTGVGYPVGQGISIAGSMANALLKNLK